jgi:hypothetical protein
MQCSLFNYLQQKNMWNGIAFSVGKKLEEIVNFVLPVNSVVDQQLSLGRIEFYSLCTSS